MSTVPATPDSARVLDPEGFYRTGPTPFFASRDDQRFSYCLYVPTAHKEAAPGARLPLVVLLHGTQRSPERYRDAYRAFAEHHGCVVLAPLFPAGIVVPGDLHGYKRLEAFGIRYDQLLLQIVDEAGEQYRVDTERFHLTGFSGGGQFAHRFAYVHPERLASVSIGAPGRVTRINDDVPWWLGTADLAEHFGSPLDLAALRKVRVQMMVGELDTATWEIAEPGVEAGGETRVERLTTLRDNWAAHGIDVQFDVVPGLAHRGLLMTSTVQGFFADAIARG